MYKNTLVLHPCSKAEKYRFILKHFNFYFSQNPSSIYILGLW